MQQDQHLEQPRSDQVNALILLEIEHVTMHRHLRQEKALFTSGTCKIARLDHGFAESVYFINLNSFYYTIHKDVVFIKLTYDDTVSYLFPHFDNGMSSITLLKESGQIANLDEVLSNAAVLTSYETAMMDPNLRAKIEDNCLNINQKPIYYPDNVKKVIEKTGNFLNSAFSTLGGLLKIGVQKTGNYINNKLEPSEPTHVKPETKQKWDKLKKGTNQFVQVSAEFVTSLLNPVIKKGKQYTNTVTEKINNSENQKVKYAKELAVISGKAISQAFDGLVKGGTQVTKELGEQSKKIITKKYGDEVVKTITGEKQEHQNQNQGVNSNNVSSKQVKNGQKSIKLEEKHQINSQIQLTQEHSESQRLLSKDLSHQIKYPDFNDEKHDSK